MRIKNFPSVESIDGSQDALVIEQTDGGEDKSRKVSPAQIKQYVLGNSIDDIYSVMGEMGAKNLIPYPYASNSFSQRNIDFTCLSDGTINANGTNDGTGNSTFSFVGITLSKGTYIINGCPTQTGNNYRCGVVRSSDSTTLASDYGSGANFTLDADTQVRFFVQVMSGKTANNIIFKPMLRLASDTDNTYQPYAKTNKELTEVIGDLSQTGLTGDSVAAQLGTANTAIGERAIRVKANTSNTKQFTFPRSIWADNGMTSSSSHTALFSGGYNNRISAGLVATNGTGVSVIKLGDNTVTATISGNNIELAFNDTVYTDLYLILLN